MRVLDVRNSGKGPNNSGSTIIIFSDKGEIFYDSKNKYFSIRDIERRGSCKIKMGDLDNFILSLQNLRAWEDDRKANEDQDEPEISEIETVDDSDIPM